MFEPIRFFCGEASVIALASMRAHGNMRVTSDEGLRNRLRFTNRFLNPGSRLFMGNVQHADKIVVVNGTTDNFFFEADAFITARRKSNLGITFADCPPVIFNAFTPKNNPIVALAHAGYKPTLLNISLGTVEKMTVLGARRRSVRAIIGPGICRSCYEFGEEASDVFKDYSEYVKPKYGTSKFLVDLPGIIRFQLLEAGVKAKNISSFGPCTFENKFLFSARRDKLRPIQAGMVVVGIR
jgi:polyphenol oxidase